MSIILVLGASGEIGSSVAKAFSSHGKTLILVGRSSEKLERTADECEAHGANTVIVPTKLKNFIELDELAVHIAGRYGVLDTMINCLGSFDGLCPVTQVSHQDFIESMHVNFHLPWKALQSFEVLLRKSSHGKAAFPIEEYFTKNRAYNSVYGLAKLSVMNMVQQFNMENPEPTQSSESAMRVTVKCIPMPFFSTKLTRKIFPGGVQSQHNIDDAGKMIYAALNEVSHHQNAA